MLQIKRAEWQQQIDDAQARLARLDMRLRQLEDNMPDHEVIIKRIEPQQVLSVRRILPSWEDIRPFIAEVKTTVRHSRVRSDGPVMVLYHHAGYRDHDLDVEVAVPVEQAPSEAVTLPGGWAMSVRTIPAVAKAVTVLLEGGYEGIGGAYRALDTYLHTHGHAYLGPAREVYLRRSGDTDNPDEYLTEVQYPVGELSAETPADGIQLSGDWQADDQQSLPFSRRARTALEFARLEAAELEQAEISPFHVLIGLVRDGNSFAAGVLSDLGITIEQIRTSALRGQSQSAQPQISAAARQIIAFAHDEAAQLGHTYIGTEHLLLGLLRQQDSLVTHALASGGVQPEQVRAAVMQLFRQ
jgi:effector-binding domain-containing protein